MAKGGRPEYRLFGIMFFARWLCCLLLVSACAGCVMIPEKLYEPQYHNPWPQLEKVAIAPFYNLSQDPTVNGFQVAEGYFSELQLIPGFEVVPVGVTQQVMQAYGIRGQNAEEFQKLAKLMNVDAIVVGTVNDFTPYYPPRMAMTVRWYAANPCFHPIPAGYGLPWGRAEEEFIPDSLVQAAEFELAKAQLKTQTPHMPPPAAGGAAPAPEVSQRPDTVLASANSTNSAPQELAPGLPAQEGLPQGAGEVGALMAASNLPPDWPDPRGFYPAPPQPVCPDCRPHYGPVLSQTRTYNGADIDLTEALANYYEFRDDARFGGWQAYLQRSDDFIRFCCHMHITEMLAARGGAGQTKVVYRWAKSRYVP